MNEDNQLTAMNEDTQNLWDFSPDEARDAWTNDSDLKRRGMNMRVNDDARFDSYWQEVASGCHEWQRAINRMGYGMFWHKRKMVLAHRFSLERHSGEPLGTRCALHRCDNPRCVNPEHLFVGTRSDNRNPKSKLTPACIALIKHLRNEGKTFRQIARQFGVCHSAIVKIIQGKSWKHLN